jgi:hypothetical protein
MLIAIRDRYALSPPRLLEDAIATRTRKEQGFAPRMSACSIVTTSLEICAVSNANAHCLSSKSTLQNCKFEP